MTILTTVLIGVLFVAFAGVPTLILSLATIHLPTSTEREFDDELQRQLTAQRIDHEQRCAAFDAMRRELGREPLPHPAYVPDRMAAARLAWNRMQCRGFIGFGEPPAFGMARYLGRDLSTDELCKLAGGAA
jgi:hypothetical protein